MKLAELLSPRPSSMWNLIRQSGVNNVVALLRGAEQEQRTFPSAASRGRETDRTDVEPWSVEAIKTDQEIFADHGFTVVAIEDTPPMDLIRLAAPGRDEQIDHVITQIKAMGKLGIPLLSYNWMAISCWTRTDVAAEGRAGALVTRFDLADAEKLPPLAEDGSVTPEQLWDALQYFLDAVVPVAEAAGVTLSLHPDDPPLGAVRGIPRIMNSVEAYERALAMNSSAANAVTLCQGNFTLMTEDLPSVIRALGPRIAFVHFRDVIGTADSFTETFHDEGKTDMAACMRAYSEIGFEGPMRPDHVPTMHGETNDNPSYGALGRIYALGYIRGLYQSAYGEAAIRG